MSGTPAVISSRYPATLTSTMRPSWRSTLRLLEPRGADPGCNAADRPAVAGFGLIMRPPSDAATRRLTRIAPRPGSTPNFGKLRAEGVSRQPLRRLHLAGRSGAARSHVLPRGWRSPRPTVRSPENPYARSHAAAGRSSRTTPVAPATNATSAMPMNNPFSTTPTMRARADSSAAGSVIGPHVQSRM